MCGICGERDFERPVDRAVLARMTRLLAHRGPDDEGQYVGDGIALGHRRLSIIDLSPKGRQPMWSADSRLAIVFNGEVYNFAEIRRELEARGYQFVSTTDTEVVLNAVHCWGLDDALPRFIGMFAFAVWDAREQTLVLCRDRAGVKPLFYYRHPGGLLFASEMKALMSHPAMRREFDQAGLAQYFVSGNTQGESTAFKNAHRVLPGHYVRLERDGRLTSRCYWTLDSVARESFDGTFEDAADALTELCDSAFRYRLVSDVPVAVFLSGGIDSSFLSAFLARRLGQDLVHVTIGFPGSQYDEAQKASSVARQLGVRHEVHDVAVPDPRDVLDRFTSVYDEPFSDTSGIPTAILSAETRKHAKVALSADGGDEQFCGYDSYGTYRRHFERVSRLPWWLRRTGASVLARGVPYERLLSLTAGLREDATRQPQVIARFERGLEILRTRDSAGLIRLMNQKAFSACEVERLLADGRGQGVARALQWAPDLDVRGGDLIDAMMRADYKTFLRDDILTKVDRASMSVSLECRDPFLDHRLAEFAFRLPLSYLFDGREYKRLLRHVLRRWVSDDVVSAPKQGFVIPLYQWLRGPWKAAVLESLSPARLRAVGVLDERAVQCEVDRFYRYRGCRAERVLVLLLFQLWAEKWYLGRL